MAQRGVGVHSENHAHNATQHNSDLYLYGNPGRCPQNVTHTHTRERSHTHTQLEGHTDSPSSFQSSTGSSFRDSKMSITVCTAPVLCLSLVFECVSKISLTLSAWLLQWERLSRLGKECQAWVVIVKLFFPVKRTMIRENPLRPFENIKMQPHRLNGDPSGRPVRFVTSYRADCRIASSRQHFLRGGARKRSKG